MLDIYRTRALRYIKLEIRDAEVLAPRQDMKLTDSSHALTPTTIKVICQTEQQQDTQDYHLELHLFFQTMDA